MIENLAMASALVTLTVLIHFLGLFVLTRVLRRSGRHFRAHESTIGQSALVLFVVLGLFAIHTVEIWAYAFAYEAIGAIHGLETALYFSVVSFAALGYGDVVLGPEWRLFGAIEGANGLVLFGWSTAFLISVTNRLRALEHDWLDRRE